MTADIDFLTKLTPDDPDEDYNFGESVSIYKNYLAVGASFQNSNGVVYMFKYSNITNTWNQSQILTFTDSNICLDDQFLYIKDI